MPPSEPASGPSVKTKDARRHTRPQLLFAVLLVLVLLAGALVWGLAGLGDWLVVEDRLVPARAIVVLSGRIPYRAMEAAAIYRQGLAPEVWLTHPIGVEDTMKELGVAYVGEEGYNRMVLERLGVPGGSIRVLAEPILNTEQEVLAALHELRRTGGDRVIVVTSMPHTRRVRTIWKLLAGKKPEAIVRYTPEDPFDAAHWWRNTQDALDVVREVLGLINAWTGFPVRASHR